MKTISDLVEHVKDLDEKRQYRTDLKSMRESAGSRNIRNLVEVGRKQVLNMLNDNHPSPCAKDEESRRQLKLAEQSLQKSIGLLREVKDRKNGRKRK